MGRAGDQGEPGGGPRLARQADDHRDAGGGQRAPRGAQDHPHPQPRGQGGARQVRRHRAGGLQGRHGDQVGDR